MDKTSLVRFTCFAALLSLVSCAAPMGPGSDPGSAGSNGTAGTTGNGGSNATGGTTGTAGSNATGGSNPTGGSTAGSNSTGGSNPNPGAAGSVATAGTGGSTSTGGRGGSSATAGTGGASATAGTGGSTSTGGRGGSSATAGTGGASATAGTGGSGTAGTGGTGVRVDQNGVPLAKPGDMTSTSRQYLNLGDMRLINNRWGSDELGCTGTTQRVFINSDRSIGWEFNRPTCGGAKAKPDYPEVEFGVAPFGAGNVLLTTPAFSSTTLLPIQLKNMTQGSARLDQMQITLQNPSSWNINFEMWLSQRNPLTDPNPGVYAEIIVFWGWETNRWACQPAELSKPPFQAGNNQYQLCHQSDTWANGQWRYYNFNVVPHNVPLMSYTGTVDAKALADWVVTNYGLSRELWVTRFEVGSEIDDNTRGSVRIRGLTFSVNNTAKSIELQP
jgi:hypothetical protein